MEKVHCDAMNNTQLRIKCGAPHICKRKYHYHGNIGGMGNRETHRGSHCAK